MTTGLIQCKPNIEQLLKSVVSSLVHSESQHGVSLPELKKSTNLKLILNLVTIQCTNVEQKVELLQYIVVGTPCRRSSAYIEFWQSGRLARGRVLEKQPSEVRAGPPLGAKASHSKIQKWSVTQTANI